jgi:malonyl-CoA decarboxylase
MPDTNGSTPPNLIDRTWRRVRGVWLDIAKSARDVIASDTSGRPELPDSELASLRDQMQACLDARGGEVSARARAAGLGRTYLGLNKTGRLRFLKLLATEFDIDHQKVASLAGQLRAAQNEAEQRAAERMLRRLTDPPRLRLLTQFNALPEGVKFLVDLRAEIIDFAKSERDLAGLEDDLKGLLTGWFDIGFLELKRITWESPAALLEKLSAYEAVHAVRSWVDLKNRLDSDRRCFAFFHPRMPSEPLIFVEVALVSGLAGNIAALLDANAPVGDPRQADTAIFYSISNAQRGLVGISFGGFLIKRVADQLSSEFPQLKIFATLSPIPGFRPWFDDHLANGGATVKSAERKALSKALAIKADKPPDERTMIKELIADAKWPKNAEAAGALSRPMLRLMATYLLEAKREDGSARDPVAHFHLSNGARVERLNWLADPSTRGIRQSLGMMVNYRYDLADIDANHEAYAGEGRVTAASAVRGLL